MGPNHFAAVIKKKKLFITQNIGIKKHTLGSPIYTYIFLF